MGNNLPHSIESEQNILGSLIKDIHADLCRQALDEIDAKAFYQRNHQLIFDAIKQRSSKNQPVDLITLSDYLKEICVLDQVGGFVYLAELVKSVISTANILSYVELVNNAYQKRQLIQLSSQIISNANNSHVHELTSTIEQTIEDINRTSTAKSAVRINEIAESFINTLEAKSLSSEPYSGIATGIKELDERLSGFDDQGLIVLAGRPSMGKTLLAQTITANIAKRKGNSVLFFSMEMSNQQLYQRFISYESGLSADKVRSGKNLDECDWAKIAGAVQKIEDYSLYVDDDQSLSVEQIRARTRYHATKNGKPSLIVIDYLGLMSLPKADRHDISIGNITRKLKSLAKELKTPILLLAQANRDTDKMKRPTMSNLKDSGAIEADADVVMFIHCQEVIDPDTELKGIAEVIIAKDRHNQGNGTVYLVKRSGGFASADMQSVAEAEHREMMRLNPPKTKKAKSFNL
jgi:replicative DNA helicase